MWAPCRERIEVRVVGPGAGAPAPLARDAAGVFEGAIAGLGPGARYVYRLDGGPERPDPVSRSQPDGVHGPSEVVDPAAFPWTDAGWRGVPLRELRLYELHSTDHRILASYLGQAKGAEVYHADGFDGLKAQLPPSSRRAAVLMDPSYEGHNDYGRVIASLREGLQRFAEGVYMVWYPQVTKLEAAQLPRRLEALAPKGFLHVRLTVQQPDKQGFGLAGSGMFILNPPYTLHDEMQEVMPWLVDVLGQYDDANYLIEQRAA